MGKCLQKHIASSDYKVVFSSNLTVVNSKGIPVDLRAIHTFADASPVFLGSQHFHGCPRLPGGAVEGRVLVGAPLWDVEKHRTY